MSSTNVRRGLAAAVVWVLAGAGFAFFVAAAASRSGWWAVAGFGLLLMADGTSDVLAARGGEDDA